MGDMTSIVIRVCVRTDINVPSSTHVCTLEQSGSAKKQRYK